MKSTSWYLLRAVLIQVGDGSSPRIGHFQLGSTEVVPTRSVRLKGKLVGKVHVAYTPIELESDTDIEELFRGRARREAEQALEALARISAIDSRSTHGLYSVDPFIGLASDDTNTLAQLDGREMAINRTVSRKEIDSPTKILETVSMSAFGDRLEGVALLAEALNSLTPLGRYSQLIRLFESAFRLGPSDLTEPLADFLAGSKHCFEADEVREWTKARSLAVHADRRDEIYISSGVRPFESRMLEAGYDVLLNKARWRSKASDRRDIWAALSGSRGVDSGGYLTGGEAATINIQVFDGFMAYPMMLAGPTVAALPRAAWLAGDADSSRLEVLGDWEGEGEASSTDEETG